MFFPAWNVSLQQASQALIMHALLCSSRDALDSLVSWLTPIQHTAVRCLVCPKAYEIRQLPAWSYM